MHVQSCEMHEIGIVKMQYTRSELSKCHYYYCKQFDICMYCVYCVLYSTLQYSRRIQYIHEIVGIVIPVYCGTVGLNINSYQKLYALIMLCESMTKRQINGEMSLKVGFTNVKIPSFLCKHSILDSYFFSLKKRC